MPLCYSYALLAITFDFYDLMVEIFDLLREFESEWRAPIEPCYYLSWRCGGWSGLANRGCSL